MTFSLDPASTVKSTGNSSTTNIGGITTLSSGIDASVTTIPLTLSAQFPTSGTVLIGSEYITYTGNSSNQLTGCGRGAFSSTATTYTTGETVYGAFVGTTELNAQPNVAASINVIGQSGTLYLDFSNDNVLWGTFPVSGFTITDGIDEIHTAIKLLRYFRVRYIASSSNISTTFVLGIYYGQFGSPAISLNQSIQSDSTATLTRSVTTGQNPSGSYLNTKQDGSAFRTTNNLGGTRINNASGYTSSETTSFTVDSTTDFDDSGYIYIGSEIIQYASKTSTTFVTLTRGVFGTTAAAINDHDIVGGTYTSGILTLDGYTEVATKILCSNTGQMRFQWYTDSTGNDNIRTLAPSYSNKNTYDYLAAPNFGPYVRYTFSNTESTTTTDFYYETEFYTKSISAQVLTLNSNIAGAMTSNLTRSVIVGKTAGGIFNNVSTRNNALEVSINDPLTSFGEVKVAPSTAVIQLTFVYHLNNQLTTTDNLNGTTTVADSLLSVSSSSNSSSYGKLYSRRFIKYKTGQGVNFKGTAIFTLGVSGNTQLIGIGNDTNGLFFGYNGTSFGILHRNNSTDNWISQSNWNIDNMFGSGNSGMTLDPTKGNVYQIGMQWLGFGVIFFSIENSETGLFQIVHLIKYPNTYTIPSLGQPSLPITVQSINTTNTTDVIVKSSSLSGFIDGQRPILGSTFSISNTVNNINGNNTETFLLAVKVNSQINSIDAFIPVKPELLTAEGEGTGNKLIKIKTYLNPSLTGSSFTDIDSTQCVISYATTATSFSGGTSIGTFIIARNTGFLYNFTNNILELYTNDILLFTVSSSSGIDEVACSLVLLQEDSG